MNIDDLDENLDDGFIEIDISEDEKLTREINDDLTNILFEEEQKRENNSASIESTNSSSSHSEHRHRHRHHSNLGSHHRHSSSGKHHNKKKKLGLGFKILIGVLVTLLVVVIAIGAFIFSKLNKINRVEKVEFIAIEEEDFEVDEEDDLSNLTEIAPEEVTWAATEEVTGEDDIINILLIGQDRRAGQGRTRSDTMIIATFNKTDKTIKLTSLMRDLYVQIPGYSDNRMNAAYAFGGMELLDATVKTNFGVEIDGNIEVDFSGFQKVIDLVGGVDINVTDAEIYYINSYIKDNCKNLGLSPDPYYISTSGRQHLNGVQALAYSRIRYVGNGDFGRTERQRKVLMSAFDEIKNLSLSEILNLADQILPMVTTDMGNFELISLATDAFQMNISEIETHNIPQDASYQSASIRGMSVLVPNLDECRKVLKKIIYED